MSLFQTSQLPIDNDLVSQSKKITSPWIDWLVAFITRQDQTAQRLLAGPSSTGGLTLQAAAIGTTPLPTGPLGAGLFRISRYMQITQAATVNSSLTFTLSWVTNGVAQSRSGVALTTNTTSSNQGDDWPIRIDASSAISYSTAYASAGATPMQYSLNVDVEQVS